MKTVLDRLKGLYSTAKIDTADALVLAEIVAVARQIEKLSDFLHKMTGATAVNVFDVPDSENIAKVFDGIEYRFDGRKIYISKYNIDTVGKIFNGWFGLAFDFYLNGTGNPWNFIDKEGLSWNDIERRDLRWTMTESR